MSTFQVNGKAVTAGENKSLLRFLRDDLHLTGTLWGLIIPFMISTYNMIILRTSFESIPESLIEAAQIDGAGHMTILAQVVLPLSKAILAVMVLY